MKWLLWALVAWCKDMKGVDVGYQLLDSVHQARDCARGEEECHEEEVEAEERLPVPLVQWPAQQNSTHLFVVYLSRTFLALNQNTKLPTDIKQLDVGSPGSPGVELYTSKQACPRNKQHFCILKSKSLLDVNKQQQLSSAVGSYHGILTGQLSRRSLVR